MRKGTRGRRTALAPLMTLLVLGLVGALAPAAAQAERATPRVVGGAQVPVTSAPYSVYIQQATGGGAYFACTGSIIDATHVVTAAHCVVDDANATVAPSAMTVAAGTSNTQPVDAGTQIRDVSLIRREPTYAPKIPHGAGAGDVAVLTVTQPFDLSGPSVQAVPLPAPGAGPAAGTPTRIAGFGKQSGSTDPDGKLYAADLTINDPAACAGPDSALLICASSPTANVCSGDSGGGIVSGGVLVGVVSGGDLTCPPGGEDVYSNLVSPQLNAFVRGNDAPPQAPRGGAEIMVKYDSSSVGGTLTCEPGTWSNAPAFTYSFEDNATGAPVQQGPDPVHVIEPVDAGKQLRCRVVATNAGGTASVFTNGSPTISATSSLATKPRLSVSASKSKPRRKQSNRIRVTVRPGDDVAVGRGQLCLSLPSRTSVTSLGGGKRVKGGKVCWDVTRVARNATATFGVTVRSSTRGRKSFTARLARAGTGTLKGTRRVRVR